MKKKIIIVLIIILSIISLFYLNVDEQDLGDTYYYLPKYESIDVGYSNGAIVYKSLQKYSFSDIKISEDITKVNSNKEFVIAEQEKYNPLTEPRDSNKTIKNYFIIDKESDTTYGPYDKATYMEKRIILKVPVSLKLD